MITASSLARFAEDVTQTSIQLGERVFEITGCILYWSRPPLALLPEPSNNSITAWNSSRCDFLELILKLEIALSNIEESGYSRSFRTGSNERPCELDSIIRNFTEYRLDKR